MTWIDGIKGLFRRSAAPEARTQEVRFIPAVDNPYGIDVWDCTAFTQFRLSMSADPGVAARFASLRGSKGEEHRDQRPAQASVTECALQYALRDEFPEGPMFKASEMEDKWDVYFFSPHIYFARSWSGQLIYRATVRSDRRRMEITLVESAEGQDPEYSRRAVDYLVKSHILGSVVPHPLPPDLPAGSMQIATFSFATFGRRCFYGTYADSTVLPAAPAAIKVIAPT
jgi:hypothetical protein